MKNCLVTKLKAVVNNPDLEKLGVFSIVSTASAGAAKNISVKAPSDIVISSPDGGKVRGFGSGSSAITDWVDTLSIPASSMESAYGISIEANHTFEIKNKYNLIYINLYHGGFVEDKDVAAFKYMTNMINIVGDFKGSIDNLSGLSLLIKFDAGRSSNSAKLTGNISDLRMLSNLENLNLSKNTAIKGELCFAGPLTSLTEFMFRATKITGSVEDFVAAQRGAGRTTCDGMSITPRETAVTFNGASISSNNATTLSWTASTITYNGTTINNSSIITPTELEERIAAWVDPNA